MPKNKFSSQKTLDLNDQFTFGKYKYSTVLEVLRKDPGYLIWVLENVDGYVFADDIELALEDETWRAELLEDHSGD